MLLIAHISALGVCFPQFFSWSGVAIFFFLYWVTGWLGITLGYHRLLTHTSFKTYKWIRSVLTLFGCLAWQGPPITWVGTHRNHHNHSDKEGDSHSPIHGFNWAHMLWVVTKDPPGFNASNLAKDLGSEPMMRTLDRVWWLPQLILATLLFCIGWGFGGVMLAFSWLFWGVSLRIIAVLHATWFVNSACHTWGYKNFHDTGDNSRNLLWVGLISGGEGYHNDHHKKQRSAAHGIRWFEIDATYLTILLMKYMGLAWDIVPPPELPEKVRE